MPKLVNRAKMTTATTGTGTITLGSAVDGYQTFAAAGVANADVVRYVIEDGDAWEIGLGTYTASGTTLTRGSIESSNADNPINLSGTALVFLTVAGGDLQHAADMNQGVATTDSPTFAGLTATTADINGGTIDGTTIGGSTPAAGTFSSVTVNGNITVTGTVDGRDVAADGSKLDGIEAGADVTDTANVTAAGALMASEITNLAAVKAFDPTDYTQPGDNVSTLTNDAGYAASLSDLGISATATELNYVSGVTSAIQDQLNSKFSSTQRLFAKADATAVAWTKTGNGTAETQTTLYAEVNGSVLTVASGTSITMPTLTAGTDYAIWLETDGDLVATTDHTSPPTANARKVGGFHYAAGSNATGTSGGNTTAQINEYSFWDLNFKPACPDPRGMTLVGGGFWVDIYLTGVDAITNGSSKYNVTIADGSSPPKVPTMFGGNGSTTYGSYTWFEAQELATAFGKRCLTQLEFMSAMYGTTEASSIGTDPVTTNWDAAYVSKWGVNQATGCMWVWGRDRGGPAAGASWNANTEGRGSEYNAPNASHFGGHWGLGSVAGSRCSGWSLAASFSFNDFGSRFACDHLQLG